MLIYIYMMLQMHACCAAFRNPHASMRWQCHSRMGNMPHAHATAADIVQHSNQCCRMCSHYIHLKKQHSNQRMHWCFKSTRRFERTKNTRRAFKVHGSTQLPVNMSSRYKNCWTCTVYCLAHWVTWVSTVKADWSPSFVLRVWLPAANFWQDVVCFGCPFRYLDLVLCHLLRLVFVWGSFQPYLALHARFHVCLASIPCFP